MDEFDMLEELLSKGRMPASQAATPYETYKAKRQEVVDRYQKPLEMAEAEAIAVPKADENELLTQAIYSLGPALLAGLGGSAGAKAAPSAFSQAQGMAKDSRDANSRKAQADKEAAKDRYGRISKQRETDLGDVREEVAFMQREQDQAENRALRREMQADRRDGKAASKAEKVDREVDKDVQKLSAKLPDLQSVDQAYEAIDSVLGAPLDEITVEGSKLKAGGKTVDLPGVSVPGIGRVSAYSGDARKLESSMAAILNRVIKDRAGAAVSNSEMERIRQEFGSGKYNTEGDMINALKEYKRAVGAAMKNAEAGFRPEVVEEYRSRGGVTSKNMEPKAKEGQTKVWEGVTYKLVGDEWVPQ